MKFNSQIFFTLFTVSPLPHLSSAFAPSNIWRERNICSKPNDCILLRSTVLKQEDAFTTTEEPTALSGMDNIAMMEEPSKSYLDDGFVFGLDGSGIERPKGKQANVVVEGDSLETTPQQVAIVSATFLAQFLIGANAIAHLYSNADGNVALTAAESMSTIVASYILADFGSGVLHWSVDNYGNCRTPIMGSIIAAFQGHHSAPWTITYRGFFNNVWKLCIPFGIPTVGAISYVAGDEHPLGEQQRMKYVVAFQTV